MNWGVMIAAIAAAGSAVAALANLQQARKAARSTEASAYLQLISEYANHEMRGAISHLSQEWRTASSEGLVIEAHYNVLHASDPAKSEIVRRDCRIISSYFVDAYRLYQAGLITKKVLKLAIAHPGLNVFYEVCVPLNRQNNGGHNSIDAGKCLKIIVPIHGGGIY